MWICFYTFNLNLNSYKYLHKTKIKKMIITLFFKLEINV